MKPAGQPKTAAPDKDEPQPNPAVDVGDHVYVTHKGGPCTALVIAHGKHGMTCRIDGGVHKLLWDTYLGHKKRPMQRYSVVDQGEDGMIVEDANKRRRYIGMPNEAQEDPMVAKAQRPTLLFVKAAGMAPGPGLSKKTLVDKNGVQTTRWVSVAAGSPPAQRGQHVGFENGEHRGHGKVHAVGQHGVTVKDQAEGEHRVRHEQITHHWGGDGDPDGSPHDQVETPPKVQPHAGSPETFSATDFAAQHDDKSATADSIVEGFGGDARKRIDAARERVSTVKQTIDEHAKDGVFDAERSEMHRKLIFDGVEINGKKVPGLLSTERVAAATPPAGQKPTFIALGGRGGSGKSSLNGRVYSEQNAVVLDADHIKGMLPEYEGWNAHQVHEESSMVLDAVLRMAQILGLNVVLDATMKGAGIAEKIDTFKKSGFRTEAHYMHLPRQEATKRAVSRFLNGGEKGRFVPPEVVMGNTQNEANFDKIKDKVDAWSFHDNSGAKDAGPTLIAKKGDAATAPKKMLIKSEQVTKMLLWKQKK